MVAVNERILGRCTMDDNGVRNTLDSLLAGDPDVMDRDQLAGFVSQLGRIRVWCAAAEVRVSRRTRQLAAEGRSELAAALLSDGGRCSSKDAHTASERETICGAMPSFEDALATGAVSAKPTCSPMPGIRVSTHSNAGVVTWPAISLLKHAPTLTLTSWMSSARVRRSGGGTTS